MVAHPETARVVKPQVRLRSPWRWVRIGVASLWIVVAAAMMPSIANGNWVAADGGPYSWSDAVSVIILITVAGFFLLITPSTVVVRDGQIRFRELLRRRQIELAEVLDVVVAPRPGAYFDAVAPLLILRDREILLAELSGYPRKGTNRRVQAQAEALRAVVKSLNSG